MMQFNLLPYRAERRRRRLRQFLAALALAALLGCSASGIAWHAIGIRQQHQEARNEWLRQAAKRMEKEIRQGEKLRLETEAVSNDIAKIENWRHRRGRTAGLLATVSAQMPSGAHLQIMRQQDGKATIEGLAASNLVVTELLQNLNRQTDEIASAQLLETHAEIRSKNGAFAFSIAMTLR